jgi:hypothetical protein
VKNKASGVPVGLLMALFFATAPPVSAAITPNPNEPYIEEITYSGNGCAPGTVDIEMSDGQQAFTARFSQFAVVGPSGPNMNVPVQRNCSIVMQTFFPVGESRFCMRVMNRGRSADPGGRIQPRYQLGGVPLRNRRVSNGFVEYYGGDYARSDVLPVIARADSDAVLTGRYPIAINPLMTLFYTTLAGEHLTIDSMVVEFDVNCETDSTPPVVTITSPVAGALYGLNAQVASAYSCQDDDPFRLICDAPVFVNTSTLGPNSFSVTAIDFFRNQSIKTVEYGVGELNDCKLEGWRRFVMPSFSNQGQCQSHYGR